MTGKRDRRYKPLFQSMSKFDLAERTESSEVRLKEFIVNFTLQSIYIKNNKICRTEYSVVGKANQFRFWHCSGNKANDSNLRTRLEFFLLGVRQGETSLGFPLTNDTAPSVLRDGVTVGVCPQACVTLKTTSRTQQPKAPLHPEPTWKMDFLLLCSQNSKRIIHWNWYNLKFSNISTANLHILAYNNRPSKCSLWIIYTFPWNLK